MVAPFVLLLGAIAVLPLIPATAHWWESNLHRFYVAGGLAAITLVYYLTLHAHPLEAHWPAPHVAPPSPGGPNFAQTGEVLANAILSEYVPFIVLLFSLYTISGGIRIEGDLPAHPLTNVAFLAAGARAGEFHRHDRRGDAVDPSAAGNQPRAKTRQAHGHLLHFHRVQLRRLPAAAGRSAAVPGLPDGRAVSVDARALEGVALRQRRAAGDLLSLGSLLVLSARDGRPTSPATKPAVHRLRFGGVWPNAAAAGRRDPFGGAAGPRQAVARHRLASVAVSAGGRAIGAGGRCRWRWAPAMRGGRTASTTRPIIEVAVLFFGIFICMQPALQILASRGRTWG